MKGEAISAKSKSSLDIISRSLNVDVIAEKRAGGGPISRFLIDTESPYDKRNPFLITFPSQWNTRKRPFRCRFRALGQAVSQFTTLPKQPDQQAEKKSDQWQDLNFINQTQPPIGM